MNKKALSFAILLSILSPLSTASASPYVPQATFPSRWSVDAAWLYFSPTSETTYYYVNSDIFGNVDGSRNANRFDNYYSGYRIALGYLPIESNNYFSVTWSDLKATHSNSDSNGASGVHPTLGPANLSQYVDPSAYAEATKHFHYFAIDGILGYTLLNNNLINLSLFGGLHYAKLISDDSYSYTGFLGLDGSINSLLGKQISNFWGVGPQFGFNGRLPIWRGLSVFGNAAGSILVGQPKTSLSASQPTSTAGVIVGVIPFYAENERVWRCVPQGDLQIGFNYDFAFCRKNRPLSLSLEIGYEMLTYFNGLSNIEFISTSAPGLSFDDYRNVTMHGLTLGVAIGF